MKDCPDCGHELGNCNCCRPRKTPPQPPERVEPAPPAAEPCGHGWHWGAKCDESAKTEAGPMRDTESPSGVQALGSSGLVTSPTEPAAPAPETDRCPESVAVECPVCSGEMHETEPGAPAPAQGEPLLTCEDCTTPYRAFPLDVTLPDEQWALIHPSGGGGVLCAHCLVKRAGRVPGAVAVRAHIEIAGKAEAAPATKPRTVSVVELYRRIIDEQAEGNAKLRDELAKARAEADSAKAAAVESYDLFQKAQREAEQLRRERDEAVKKQNGNAYAAVVLGEELNKARTALAERERAAFMAPLGATKRSDGQWVFGSPPDPQFAADFYAAWQATQPDKKRSK